MIRRLRFAALLLLSGLAMAVPLQAGNGETLALVGATIFTTPDAPPLHDAVVLISEGRITAVGSRASVKVPQNARVIQCAGKYIVAGFWNSHVHFTDSGFNDAANAPRQALEKHMQEMLTQWGFTSVWDLGSLPANSLALRKRVELGDVPGPKIFLAGSIFPKGGHPVYLPPEMQLPEAATPEQAAQMARDDLQLGLDGMKLFTGAFMGNKPVINMDTAMVKAAVEVAHGQGKPVFAHPQNTTGVDNAIAGGVDILAHTVPGILNFSAEELARFKAQHTILIPTLTLWTTILSDPAATERVVQNGVEQLKAFSGNGGIVLFGTDTGFTTNYDTTLEFELMHRALTPRQILASLTVNPAGYFREKQKGRVAKGMDADLVVLDGDPLADVRNLARVAYTMRGGKIIYRK
jgi:imidazolonepropionase-like amidohydrolase